MAAGVSHEEEQRAPLEKAKGWQPSCWGTRRLTLDESKTWDLKAGVGPGQQMILNRENTPQN